MRDASKMIKMPLAATGAEAVVSLPLFYDFNEQCIKENLYKNQGKFIKHLCHDFYF